MRLGAWIALMLGIGCGGSGPAATPQPAEQSPAKASSVPDGLDTDLPAARPSPFELDLRQRTDDGDDVVLKLTEAGARYGLARGQARVALRYRLDPAQLDEIYATLRRQGFDRIETEDHQSGPGSGSSMRVKAGPVHHSVSAMGRRAPTEAWAQAYARSEAAAEALLPRGRSDVVVLVRWDRSMDGRAAALDVDLGDDFVGIHPRPGPRPDVELHLARRRELQALVRHGSPPSSSTLTIEAGRDHGIEVAYDGASASVVLRPLPQGPTKTPTMPH